MMLNSVVTKCIILCFITLHYITLFTLLYCYHNNLKCMLYHRILGLCDNNIEFDVSIVIIYNITFV